MSNFFSALGQGLTQFGHQRQQRQQQDYDVAREEQRYKQQLADKDRAYAWQVAENLAPDQELDDASFGALSQAGPEIAAYVATDPTTGKRTWRGTQQQRTRAAQEKAATEAAERNNALVKRQQEELDRRENLNKTVAQFTATTGRRPTREELFKMMSETQTLDPKMVMDWDLEDQRIKAQEAIAARAYAAAGRDNRYTPGGGGGARPPAQLDVGQLKNAARVKFAQGQIEQGEYDAIVKELNRVEGLQRNPLQFYMNDVQNDLTTFGNRALKPGQQPKAFKDFRNPQAMDEYLQYVQSDPDWQMQAQADLQDPASIQRYVGFLKQLREKWAADAAAQPQSQGWFGGWFGGK